MAPSGRRGRGRSRALQTQRGSTSIPSRSTATPSRSITPQRSSIQESTPPQVQPTQMAPSGKRGRGRSRALQARGGSTSIPSRCTSAPSRSITPQGSSVQERTPPQIQPSPRLSNTDTHASASTVPSTNPTPPPRKKTRGPSVGLDSNKLVSELHGPIQLTFDLTIGRPNNPEHNKMFTTECGVICRNHAPLRLSRWGDISSTSYAELVRHLQGKFQWDKTDTLAIEFINKQLGQVWRQQRCNHAKRIQGLIAKGSDPQAHPATGVSQADWEWIVDFVCSDTYQARSRTNKANREKQLYGHRAGSKPFMMHLKEKEVGPVDLFKDTHFSHNKGWINNEAAALHREMEEQRQLQSQSTIKGKPISFNELEIMQQVLGHRSGYICGLGWGPRPANHGQCSRNNTMSSSAVSELKRLQKQLETQRVQLETQQKYISTLQPVVTALLQRFPELGVLNSPRPKPQMPRVLESKSSDSSRDSALSLSDT